MNIVDDYPPNIDAIREVFPLSGGEIFAYGDTIYSPGFTVLPEWLVEHEKVHQRQQGDDVEGWWARYLVDPEWRLEQELEAHRAEYRCYFRHHKDRNARYKALREMGRRLASPMYGSIISQTDAMRRIAS